MVEDDSTLSFIIQDAFTREGFDVVCASNGEAGLKLFKETDPDIIVADVMMPKMDGFEMVRLIRLTAPAIPVLFLTARTALDDVVKRVRTRSQTTIYASHFRFLNLLCASELC